MSEVKIEMTPIGHVESGCASPPRHWTVSEVEGRLVIAPEYAPGLADIAPGERIVVLFCFHRSPPFSPDLLRQTPPHRSGPRGVFSICSPRRPNPIGLSVLEVLAVEDNTLRVRGLDMLDGTPILDIKPWVTGPDTCPSREDRGADGQRSEVRGR